MNLYNYSDRGSTIFNMCQIDTLPVTVSHLQAATHTDIVLCKVLHYTLNGWPQMVSKELKPFFNRCNELTVECNCLRWGIRIVAPSKLRQKVLQEVHISHFCISKMKQLARGYIWGLSLTMISNSELKLVKRVCLSTMHPRYRQ